jgi:hypothetical protein
MQQQRQHSGIILGLLALCLLAGAALTAGPAQAASGVGPFLPEPAWDRKLPAGFRFYVLTNWNNEAVLDKETGLVWEKSPQAAPDTWSNARVTCMNKNVGGRKGWRLPSIPELASLIDPSVAVGPTLPSGHPFINIQSADYWSATTNVETPTRALDVNFGIGLVDSSTKTSTDQVWCVRGGMNADAY